MKMNNIQYNNQIFTYESSQIKALIQKRRAEKVQKNNDEKNALDGESLQKLFNEYPRSNTPSDAAHNCEISSKNNERSLLARNLSQMTPYHLLDCRVENLESEKNDSPIQIRELESDESSFQVKEIEEESFITTANKVIYSFFKSFSSLNYCMSGNGDSGYTTDNDDKED